MKNQGLTTVFYMNKDTNKLLNSIKVNCDKIDKIARDMQSDVEQMQSAYNIYKDQVDQLEKSLETLLCDANTVQYIDDNAEFIHSELEKYRAEIDQICNFSCVMLKNKKRDYIMV